MTSPNLNVDTEELIQLANGHEELVDVLSGGGGPPQIKGRQEFASSAAADAALGTARANQDRMAAKVGSNADGLRASASGYQGQESASKGQLGEAVKLGEIAQLLGVFGGIFSSLEGAAGSAFGSAIGAGADPVNGLIGAVSSATIGDKGGHGHEHKTDVEPDTGLLGEPPPEDGVEGLPAVHPHPIHGHEAHAAR